MTIEKPKTRLAAILFADVQGFSRLAGEDEKSADQTLRSYREVIALCPENPMGHNLLAWVHWDDLVLGSTKSPRESFEQALTLAQKTLARDNSLPGAHALLCLVYSYMGEHARAIAEGERAVSLEPNGLGGG
jgi:hypothetical protein